VADKDDVDPTQESGDPAPDPAGREPHGSHAVEPTEPAVSGVPADADEPTFRDRERLEAEGRDLDEGSEPEGVIEGDDKELVAVGAATSERAGGTVNETPAAARARQKKEKATPRQKQTAEQPRRTTPVVFVKESVSELQKVVYPTGQQLINYFVVVLIFVLFIIAIVSVLDLAFGKAIIAVFS
jgi:preprotein translocase subunit SecE